MTLPPAPAGFAWTREPWGVALRCAALQPFAPHLFSSRQLAFTEPGAVASLAASVGASSVRMAAQVHGRGVVAVRRDAEGPTEGLTADVLVGDRPGVAVAVRTADCVPVLLVDRRTGAVAAVHAGWRGTSLAAAAAAVEAMRGEFGTAPADIVAAIGPAIGSCCYEVGSDVVDAFAAAGHGRHLIARWFHERPTAPGTARAGLRLDLAGANRDQLVLTGVPDEQVHVSGLCTAMHLDVLTSYRAERQRAGRLVAAITPGPPV